METTFLYVGVSRKGRDACKLKAIHLKSQGPSSVSGQTVNKLSAYSAHCVADTVKASPQS